MAFKNPMEQSLLRHCIDVGWKVPHATTIPRFVGLLLRTYDNRCKLFYISKVNNSSFTCLAITHSSDDALQTWFLDHELYILAKAAKGNIAGAFKPHAFDSLFQHYRSICLHQSIIEDHIKDAREEGTLKL